jgi:hypothetical protein
LGNKSYQPGLICPLPASRPWLEAAKEGLDYFSGGAAHNRCCGQGFSSGQ